MIDDTRLFQGDIIDNLEFVVRYSNDSPPEIAIMTRDVIILSRTSDMVPGRVKIRNVLISPLIPLSEFEEENPIYRSNDFKESIRRGYIPNFFLLDEINSAGTQKEYCIVNFREIFFIDYEKVHDSATQQGQRIRLKSPYREAMAQAFGKYMMKVGYPKEIPFFARRIRTSEVDEDI